MPSAKTPCGEGLHRSFSLADTDVDRTDSKTASVETWFETQGYAVEYQSANILKAAGFDVGMDLFVQDPNGTSRDIDVYADTLVQSHNAGVGKVRLLVECKYSRLPWVLLTGHAQYGGIVDVRYCTSVTESAKQTLMRYGGNTIGGNHFDPLCLKAILYSISIPRGHSLVEAKVELLEETAEKRKDKQPKKHNAEDGCYRTVQKIAGACRWHMEAASTPSGWRGAAIPLIVLSGPLYAGWYDKSDSKIKVKEINFGGLVWRGVGDLQLVYISTLRALPEISPHLRKSCELVADMINPAGNQEGYVPFEDDSKKADGPESAH